MSDINSEFEAPKKEIDISKLQRMVVEARDARTDYDEKKTISTAAYNHYRGLELGVLAVLQECNLKKFHVKSMGTAYIITSTPAKVPKLIENKIKLFDWIQEKRGEDVLHAFLTINANSFKSFYAGELKAASEKGEFLKMPGVEEPIKQETLGFRKDSK